MPSNCVSLFFFFFFIALPSKKHFISPYEPYKVMLKKFGRGALLSRSTVHHMTFFRSLIYCVVVHSDQISSSLSICISGSGSHSVVYSVPVRTQLSVAGLLVYIHQSLNKYIQLSGKVYSKEYRKQRHIWQTKWHQLTMALPLNFHIQLLSHVTSSSFLLFFVLEILFYKKKYIFFNRRYRNKTKYYYATPRQPRNILTSFPLPP